MEALVHRKSLFRNVVIVIFAILVLNFFANVFHWYFSIWYFDMIMHFLGGFWLGLFFIYISKPQSLSSRLITDVLVFVFVVGVSWEIYEILVNEVLAKNAFNAPDTISDIFFDLSGGSAAILYSMCVLKNKLN